MANDCTYTPANGFAGDRQLRRPGRRRKRRHDDRDGHGQRVGDQQHATGARRRRVRAARGPAAACSRSAGPTPTATRSPTRSRTFPGMAPWPAAWWRLHLYAGSEQHRHADRARAGERRPRWSCIGDPDPDRRSDQRRARGAAPAPPPTRTRRRPRGSPQPMSTATALPGCEARRLHGTVTCSAAGVCSYAPFANYNGADSFEAEVNDGHGGGLVRRCPSRSTRSMTCPAWQRFPSRSPRTPCRCRSTLSGATSTVAPFRSPCPLRCSAT